MERVRINIPFHHVLQLDWSPDHSATGQPHPKELLGRSIERNDADTGNCEQDRTSNNLMSAGWK